MTDQPDYPDWRSMDWQAVTHLENTGWMDKHDAEVARAAAEKAWDEGYTAQRLIPRDPPPPTNPYRADAES